MNIKKIEGIGPVYADLLEGQGIKTTKSLLKSGASRIGRKNLSFAIGISPTKILEWVNRADLMRVRGVGEEYSDLLEAAGVDTVRELAQRNSENLLQKFEEVNQEKKLVRRLPTLAEVERWVEHAKLLPPVITY